jgi:hypothetical protein
MPAEGNAHSISIEKKEEVAALSKVPTSIQ